MWVNTCKGSQNVSVLKKTKINKWQNEQVIFEVKEEAEDRFCWWYNILIVVWYWLSVCLNMQSCEFGLSTAHNPLALGNENKEGYVRSYYNIIMVIIIVMTESLKPLTYFMSFSGVTNTEAHNQTWARLDQLHGSKKRRVSFFFFCYRNNDSICSDFILNDECRLCVHLKKYLLRQLQAGRYEAFHTVCQFFLSNLTRFYIILSRA